MTFEIVPVVPSKETAEVVAPFLDEKVAETIGARRSSSDLPPTTVSAQLPGNCSFTHLFFPPPRSFTSAKRDHRSPAYAKRAGGPSRQVDAPSLHERTTIIYPDGNASAG